jgi:hypothetical protein
VLDEYDPIGSTDGIHFTTAKAAVNAWGQLGCWDRCICHAKAERVRPAR